jgi:putative copper export protein
MIAAERSRIGVSFDQLFRSGTGHELIRQGVGLGVAAVAVILLVAWPGRGTLLLLAGTAAVTMYLHAQAGHAGASQNFTWFNVGVQWVHLLAVGVWVGGLVWLLLGTWGADPAERPTAVKRFSTIAGIALFAVAVTGVLRMVDELGGWTEWGRLLSTAFGVTILVKVGLFAGMVVLGARNRYVNVPGIAEGARRLGSLRRSVTSEIVIAAGILGATGVLTQLPPASAVSPPPAPVSVQQVVATGHDFATSVRVRLTATPGTVGLNTFEANVVDYDTRRPVNASRVQLTFSLPGKPELGSPTLELRRKGSTWTGAGTVLSMFGRWDVTLLVQQAAESTTVPLHLEPRLPHLPTQILPGNPVVYSVSLPDGNSLQAYIDPGDAGPNAVHFTFFKPSGKELPIASARATELSESGETRSLKLIRFDKGHFVANVDLRAGRWTFLIDVSIGEGSSISANFSETIGSQGGTT